MQVIAFSILFFLVAHVENSVQKLQECYNVFYNIDRGKKMQQKSKSSEQSSNSGETYVVLILEFLIHFHLSFSLLSLSVC